MFLGVVSLAIGYARLAACLLPLLAGTPISLPWPPECNAGGLRGTTSSPTTYHQCGGKTPPGDYSSDNGWCFFNAAPNASRSSVR